MTSTNFNVGLGSSARNSSKVLKPPGGGSSDIFGAAEQQPEPRKSRPQPQQQSSLFISHDEPATVKTKAGNESEAEPTLYGGTELRFNSAAKNKDRFKSNIVLGYDNTPPTGKAKLLAADTGSGSGDDGDTELAKDLPPISVSDSFTGTASADGNAVTGNGYHKPEVTQPDLSQPQPPNESGSGVQSAARQRVPPGGFSSGLW